MSGRVAGNGQNNAGRRVAKAQGESVRVRGLVQGVGFRPTVWRVATECGLSGEVGNDGAGVFIRMWGSPERRARFLRRLQSESPPLARIQSLEIEPLYVACPEPGFRIVPSRGGPVQTGVIPDAATCPECLADISDPDNRRYGYPFANCTHCGPRLSIVSAIPYDRQHTSMADFPLCDRCRGEYDDPGNRRFHAQPNACPDCGPRLWLEGKNGLQALGARAIESAGQLLQEGHILAVKGIGGFHLAVDAGNDAAVRMLRRRKRRASKPFALMARNIDMIRRYCMVSEEEQALLESPAGPVVLLEAREGRLSSAVAPGQRTLGFMLPYSPLHHLLVKGLKGPIVLTSGNLSDAPQCTANGEARTRLGGIADYWLLHDRAIVNRVDDSVARVVEGQPRILRRARGYAPEPIPMPAGFADAPAVLAMGSELKNSFCLLRDGQAVLSQHIGDLENAGTLADYQKNLSLYRRLFDHDPASVAVDRHPEYLSTKVGAELAHEQDLPLVSVQHHHAHIASCMAENGVPLDAPPVLGIALDGLGAGEDGTLWGGEFLLADYRGFSRLGSLAPVPMPGGAQAIREPWRMAYAHLRSSLGWRAFEREFGRLELAAWLRERPLATLERMCDTGLNTPMSSSCGRLFDAVAAAVGVCRERVDYEGQAAIELEALVDAAALEAAGPEGYGFSIRRDGGLAAIDCAPLWRALLGDLAAKTPMPVMAARFHLGLAQAIVELASTLAHEQGVDTVALSGGVFQNRLLFEAISARLRVRGFTVLSHRRVPAGDGGLALGQAAVAQAQMQTGQQDVLGHSWSDH